MSDVLTGKEILDNAAIEGLELETTLIEMGGWIRKALMQSTKEHIAKRDAAQKNTNIAAEVEDHEAYRGWLDVLQDEDRAVRLLQSALKDYGVSDDLIPK